MTITPVSRPLFMVASTGPVLTGFALQNATPNVLSWTAPNDGQLHRFNVIATLNVTVAETGGQVVVIWTAPDGTGSGSGIQLFAGGRAVGIAQAEVVGLMQPGTTVSIHQQTALTVGAAVVWADIWGS